MLTSWTEWKKGLKVNYVQRCVSVEVRGQAADSVCAPVVLLQMNLALVHDRELIKTFWERRIETQTQQADSEEQRMSQSALKK